MKRSILTCLLLVFVLQVYCQHNKGTLQVDAGIGKVPAIDLLLKLTRYNPDEGSLPGWQGYTKYRPVYNVNASYYFSNRFSGGLLLAQHSYAMAYFNDYSQAKVYSYFDAVTIALSARYDLVSKPLYTFYFNGALGVFIVKGSSESFYLSGGSRKTLTSLALPGAYISCCGFRYGNKVAGYAEIGFGTKGLINGGFSVRL